MIEDIRWKQRFQNYKNALATMIEDRNLASHWYDEETAVKIYNKIVNIYYKQLILFKEKMDSLEDLCNTESTTVQ